MTPEDAPLVDLVQKLTQLTERNVITWSGTPEREDSFEVDLTGSNIDIASIDEDGAPPYVLRVWLRKEGNRAFEKVSEANSKEDREWAPHLHRLYGLARRQISGTEKKIRSIISELESIENEPPF